MTLKALANLAAAGVIAVATPAAAAVYTPSTSVTYDYIHGPFTITDNGPDVITVDRGQSFVVTGTWSASETDNSYCPDCIIQLYVSGLNPISAQADLISRTGITASGDYSLTVSAPTTDGVYWIGGASSLQYHFITTFGHANSDGLVNYQVNVIPEPSTWCMMLIGFALLGFAGYRTARRSDAVAD